MSDDRPDAQPAAERVPRQPGRWRHFGAHLREPEFLLDIRAARHIEAFLNQARLVLVGCLLLLTHFQLLPGSSSQLMLLTADVGIAWVLCVGVLVRYVYRPWIAIAIAVLDTLFVSALIYSTGGPTSPLDSLYGIILFAAIIRFSRIHAVLVIAAIVLAYVEVVWLHPAYSYAEYANELATRALILVMTAILAWLVAMEVTRQRRATVEAQQQLSSLETVTHVTHSLAGPNRPDDILGAAAALTWDLIAPSHVAVALAELPDHPRLIAMLRGKSGADAAIAEPVAPDELVAGPMDSPEALATALAARWGGEVVSVPIGDGSNARGWLLVGVPSADQVTPADRALLERIGDETAWALQRSELLDRERERSRRLARLAEDNGRLLDTERATVARLRQLAMHKDVFIDMIAHELRTPLTSIKGFTQMLQRLPPGTGASERYATFILAESNRLVGIIDDIVDLSRMERGLLEMRQDAVEVSTLLDDVVAGARDSAQSVQIAAALPGQSRGLVLGDPEKLRQSLLSLVQTASRYHRGGEPMRLDAERHGEDIHVTLSIDGTVPDQRLTRMFERVPSGPNETRLNLGLYICKNFVEAHGGRLWLEQRPGQGQFHVALPLMATDAPRPDTDRVVARSARHTGRRIAARLHRQASGHEPRGDDR